MNCDIFTHDATKMCRHFKLNYFPYDESAFIFSLWFQEVFPNFLFDFTYLHDLSSKPEKPGIPDKPVWDDGWFDTYGYIL